MKLQHGFGGLEVLEGFPLDYEKRVFVEDSEKRIFGIHAAMMGLSASLRDSVAGYDLDRCPPRSALRGRGPTCARPGGVPVRVRQVPLPREMAGRHQRVPRRAGLPDAGRAGRRHGALP
ncbi:hypothetical protein AB0K15_43930 [Amycolatopsis sp. NPDC049253]|uniref:hypothetical protein n=1 Tax=Amycolatopsis sp. NPDC049253 TaxID=3155274 RepID=UPI0034270B92